MIEFTLPYSAVPCVCKYYGCTISITWSSPYFSNFCKQLIMFIPWVSSVNGNMSIFYRSMGYLLIILNAMKSMLWILTLALTHLITRINSKLMYIFIKTLNKLLNKVFIFSCTFYIYIYMCDNPWTSGQPLTRPCCFYQLASIKRTPPVVWEK